MTVQEALAELGVEPGADVETIRRAYLRLVKTRKPEADPEGFKRAREAFEVARGAGEMEALMVASATPEPPPSAEASAGDPEKTPPPVRIDPFQPYLDAWKAIPASSDMRLRLKVAVDARAALPDDRRAYWLVVSTLDGRALNVDLAEALRAGWRQGWPEFLEALLLRLPGTAARAEVDAALQSPREPLRLLGATVVARWDATRAASVVVETCEGILSAPPGGAPRAVPVERMLQVVLALHELRAVSEATRAQAALRRCLQETGLELRLMSGPLGGLWILAEELGRLPADFPLPLRAAFAAAARSGDMRSAFFEACFHVRHHKREVRAWVKRLGETVPNVVGTLRGAIQREAAKKRSFNFSGIRWYVVIWPAFMLLRFLVSGDACVPSYTDHTHPPVSEPVPRVADPRLVQVRDLIRQECDDSGPRHGQLVCADIQATLAALDAGECAEVQPLPILKQKLRVQQETELDARLVTNLELVTWQICPGLHVREPKSESNW